MPAINPLPTPPSRNDPANFSDRADAFLAALPAYTSEANALLDDVHTSRDTVQGLRNEVIAAGLENAAANAATAATKAAEAASSASEAFGYLQAYRATSYGALAADPVVDPNGNPPTVGDEYFNTSMNLLKRFNGATWQASDITTANLAAPGGSTLVGLQQEGTGAVKRTVQSKLREFVSVKDFGALGDGTGRTPADDGVNILTASWNTWDGTPFKTNLPWSPYGTGGTFVPPRAQPFANDDTWDFIGISLALWSATDTQKSVYIPAGNYRINLSSATAKGGFNGLLIMKGQEQTIYGAGVYETQIMPKEGAAFFAANNVGVADAYQLLTLYRTGGPPTHVRDIAFIGPDGYTTGSGNLSLILCPNINGVTIRDIWLSSADRGISANTNSGDIHIKGVTAEYCFGETIYTDATSDFSIDFCNLWASASVPGQRGVYAAGRTSITNSRFVEFDGGAVYAGSGVFNSNLVTSSGTAASEVEFVDDCVITGNQFSGGTATPMLRVRKDASVVGNHFLQTGAHACVNMGDGTTATNITIVGNTFVKTDASSGDQNYAILAAKDGVNFTSAATASCLIANNTFQGRALSTVHTATMSRNTFDGVLQTAVFNEAVTLAGSATNTGASIREGDVFGKEVMTGSGSTSPFTITMSGILGQGQGDERSQRRLNLVSVYTTGPSHVGRAFALYTSEYDGAAILIATLGASAVNGSITFGVSGSNPTATVTNAGGTVTYKVNAVPLI